jgi:hypothetical protein
MTQHASMQCAKTTVLHLQVAVQCPKAQTTCSIKCDLMVLWAKRSAIAVFWDAKKKWRKFCAGEVVGREVDSGHFIPEGESTIVIIRNSLLVMWLCDAEMDTKELVEEIFGFFKV